MLQFHTDRIWGNLDDKEVVRLQKQWDIDHQDVDAELYKVALTVYETAACWISRFRPLYTPARISWDNTEKRWLTVRDVALSATGLQLPDISPVDARRLAGTTHSSIAEWLSACSGKRD